MRTALPLMRILDLLVRLEGTYRTNFLCFSRFGFHSH